MIELLNTKPTKALRKQIALRAFVTQPYFYRLNFPAVADADKKIQFAQAVGINRDFYLTDIQSDFGEAFQQTNTYYEMALWTNYLQSLYRISGEQQLFTSFMSYEARFNTIVANQIFDDRQREVLPILIQNNDKIFASITNLTAKQQRTRGINIVLKGFNLLTNVFLNETETSQLNESIEAPIRPQFFQFTVNEAGKRTYILTNDSTPRLVLGFGATNNEENKVNVPEVNISIQDLSRQLNLTDSPIPLEFIAPRMTCLLDEHIYRLPIEYYWQPFAKLSFDVDVVTLNQGTGFEFNMLTRNV